MPSGETREATPSATATIGEKISFRHVLLCFEKTDAQHFGA